MTFLFKNKVIALFLLPFVMSSAQIKTRIYNLKASDTLTNGIQLTWERDPIEKDEIIEIQRSLHSANQYESLKLSLEQKKNISGHLIDTDNLIPKPTYYDYRICTISKNGKSAWSNIAKGARVPVALGTIQDTTHSKSIICTASLTLESATQKKKRVYELRFTHAHDCGKEHPIQVFLSKDGALDIKEDLPLNIIETQATKLNVQCLTNSKGYEFMILIIGNQVDVVKIK